MAFRPSQRSIRLVMLVVPSLITLAALSATAAVALGLQESSIRAATTQRVQDVATSLAGLREVRTTLAGVTAAGTPTRLADAADLADATTTLQPIAELVTQAAGVYYVVVTDDEGVRITHPLAVERGVQVSTTNASVLAGTPFVGTETGPSGPTLRAKVPVRTDDGRIVGMVAVGVLESDIEQERGEALAGLLPWAVGALIVRPSRRRYSRPWSSGDSDDSMTWLPSTPGCGAPPRRFANRRMNSTRGCTSCTGSSPEATAATHSTTSRMW